MTEPVPGARYVDLTSRVEHEVISVRCGRHKGATPLVLILEQGTRKTMPLSQWRAQGYGALVG